MKRLVLLLFAATAWAQVTNPTVQVTATAPTATGGSPVALVQSVRYMPRTIMTAFNCAWAADGIVQPGDPPVVCTLTANQQVRNGLVVTISYGQGLTGPPTVTIPTATATVTFTIAAVDLPVPVATIIPNAWWLYPPIGQTEYYVSFVTPCCGTPAVCLQLGGITPANCPAQVGSL